MALERIPLGLITDSNGVASGLGQFTLSSADLGDVCSNTPSQDQVLVYSGTQWCPSTLPAPGGGGGSFSCGDLSDCALSSLGNVCDNFPGGSATVNQFLVWNGTTWCPSALTIASAQAPLPNGAPGDVLVIPEDGSAFTDQVTSSTLFDNGIAAKNIVVDGDLTAYIRKDQGTPGAGDIITADGSNNFSNKTTSSTFFDNGIAAKNIVVDIGSAGAGDIITANGSGKFADKITSATLFDEGLAANNLNAIADVGYSTAGPGTVLVRVGSQWKAMTMPLLQQNKSEGTDTANYGAVELFDHGSDLSGLGDDDHTQYVLSGGTRSMSSLTVNNDIIAKSIIPNAEDGLNILATNVSGQTSLSSLLVKGDTINATNLTATNVTGTTITGTNINAGTQVSSASIRGDAGTFTNVTGTAATLTSIAACETIAGGDAGLAITTALQCNVSVSTPSVTGTAGTFTNLTGTNLTSTDATFTSAAMSDLNVTRVGPMNPQTYIQEADWLTPAAAANGFGSSQTGTGAGFGQCFDNDVMHPDKGTWGVYEIRSGTDAYGRAFLTTFNNAIPVSSCALSYTSRIAPSGLWASGTNEGKMCFGIRNGTSNADATYAMEFQYGQGPGGDNGGGNTWSAVVTDNSNSTVSDTGVAVVAQEFQVLQVSCSENWDAVDFYIDGVKKVSYILADHHIPDSRYNRLGLGWAINNANIWSSSSNTDGNEIFLDWHQVRMTHNNTTRGRDLIQ